MVEHCWEEKTIFDRVGFEPVSVGKRLRELRTNSGYSIKNLAEKSGLAVNTLSLIENEKTSPSVNTLEQLARALEIPLTCFFESAKGKPRIINTRKGHRRKMLLDGMLIEDCGLGLEGQPMQPLIVTLPPDMEDVTESSLHIGYEFVYCLSGKVDYYIADKKYSLFEGDSLILDASIAHRWINNSDEPAVYLLVMVPGAAENFNGEVHFQVNQIDGQ
jgi:transcriptional regulator with XRE-family HTH domain